MFILVGKADLLASLKNFGVNLDLLIRVVRENMEIFLVLGAMLPSPADTCDMIRALEDRNRVLADKIN